MIGQRGRNWARTDVDAVRQQAGVAEQSNECQNGSEGCPGPDSEVGELPCPKCFLEGEDHDREVATDGGERR